MELISKDYFMVIDVETTGFDAFRNSLIAFSCIVGRVENLEFVDQYTGYARPESKKFWSVDAEKIHGISWKDASRFPEPRDAAIGWLKFLAPYKHEHNFPMMTVYHGRGNFDPRFCEGFFTKNRLLFSWRKVANTSLTESTEKLARQHIELENYRLNTVCDHLDIELNHHEAESDTLGCFKAYQILKKMEIA